MCETPELEEKSVAGLRLQKDRPTDKSDTWKRYLVHATLKALVVGVIMGRERFSTGKVAEPVLTSSTTSGGGGRGF